jgi:hypothetical protein
MFLSAAFFQKKAANKQLFEYEFEKEVDAHPFLKLSSRWRH